MNKKYWLFLDGHTHCIVKNVEVLFYNPLNGKILKSSHVDIIELGRQLASKKNLNVIELDSSIIENTEISNFIDDLRDAFMGDIIDAPLGMVKPVQMMKQVKINRDIKYLNEHPLRSVGDFLMNYLSELNLFLTGECTQNCTFCSYAYKQCNCCTKNEGDEMSIAHIAKLLKEASSCTLLNFNLYGGNIFNYSHLRELTEILNEFSATKKVHIHYQDFLKAKNFDLFINQAYEIRVIIPTGNNSDKIAAVLAVGRQHNLNLSFIFPIESEEHYHITEQKIQTLELDNYTISPLYNGKNISFFEKNIYLEEQDICDSKPSTKDIYTREKINTNFFGKFTILSDGSIYANVNHKKRGLLGQNCLHNILSDEMTEGDSWRKVRSNTKPCSNCTFETLCPPISSYEEFIKRNNLCHIK